jgi:hypothetical protein
MKRANNPNQLMQLVLIAQKTKRRMGMKKKLSERQQQVLKFGQELRLLLGAISLLQNLLIAKTTSKLQKLNLKNVILDLKNVEKNMRKDFKQRSLNDANA